MAAVVPERAQAMRSQRRLRISTVVSAGVVIAWLVTAVSYRESLYDYYAVLSSVAILTAAVLFFRWVPPPGRESFRLLGFFVCGQAFISSGMSIISPVDTATLLLTPTQEAFSFAIESAVIFALMFLLGAFFTAPRTGHSLPDPPSPRAGPTFWVSVGISLIAVVFSVNFALTTSLASVGRLGTLPLLLFNVGLIAPMLTAQEFVTGKRRFIPLAILIAGQALITFYSSMLGILVLTMRDILLARIYLRKKLPVFFMAAMVAIVLILTPAKYFFRNAVANTRGGSSAVSFEQASGMWGDAVQSTWNPRRRGGDHSNDYQTTSHRLDYNWISAHVYRTVPHRVPYELGGTYAIIPTMLVPRFLNPDKPMGAGYARGQWFIKLGVQDKRTVELAALSLPAPAEAYWNFGWAGVFVIPFLLGSAVGLMLRLSPKDPVARVGYAVFLATTLGQFLDMLVWIVPSFVTVGAAAVLSVVYSRLGRGPLWKSRARRDLRVSHVTQAPGVRTTET